MQVVQAQPSDLSVVLQLAMRLWPDDAEEALGKELADLLSAGQTVCFLAREGDRTVAFAQCSLRQDYVEGTDDSPVGYLEGIYVLPEARRQGAAKALVQACAAWAGEHGCSQLASDCELTNTASLAFHLGSGFQEVNRVICFVKSIA